MCSLDSLVDAVSVTPRHINARFALLQFVFFMAYCAVMAFVAAYLMAYGLDSHEVGIVVAVGSVVSALAQPMLGNLADRSQRVGPSAILTVLCLVGIVASVLLSFGLPALVTAALYTLLIVVVSTAQPFVNALGLSYGPSVNFGLARAFGSLSYALAAAAFGVVLAMFAPAATNIATLVMFVLVIASLRLFPAVQAPSEGRDEAAAGADAPGGSFVGKYPLFVMLLVALFFVQLSHNGTNVFLINLMTDLGGGSSEMGFATAIAAALELPAMVLYKPLSKRFSCMNIILFSTACFVIKAVVTALSPSVVVVYGACTLQMFAFALYLPATVDYAHKAMSAGDAVKGQTLVMGVTTMAIAIAGIAGGLIIVACGVRMAFWAFAAAAAVALVVQVPLTIKARTSEKARA